MILRQSKKKIKKVLSKYHEELKRGRGIPPDELYSYTLIRSVYLSENPALINIFKRYLPIPGVDVFKGYEIPIVITENKAMIEQSIQALRDRTPRLSLDEITDNVVKIQRQLRSKLRHQEEIRRIASRREWEYELKKTSPERVIQDANTPYRPRCADSLLAKRIMVVAQQVRLFSTVKHWTSAQHIEAIFNDSLYGRRRLLESYLPFRPASLHECDIADGDGNVICFGPSEIDPKAMRPNTVEILFDLDKISENNPSIFFKQRDLGFALDKRRTVLINKSKSKSLFFSHTNSVRCERTGFAYLSVYDGSRGGLQGVAALPNYSLISYNAKNIHQILTLNFFRFLDAKINEDFKSIRNKIYADLAKLSDEELLQFLENIGRQLSDTSEFNFYGAHRIDFSTVIALSSYQDRYKASYTLNLQDLIISLERNDISMLNEAKIHLPGAFNSYRFLDYLLSKTTSILGRYELQCLRSKCITPPWVQSISEPEPLVMPVEDFSAPILVEEVTLPLDGTTQSIDEIEVATANAEPLHQEPLVMPIEDFSAPVLVEEVTLLLEGLVTTQNINEVETLTASVEPLHEDRNPHVNEMAMNVINEVRLPDIAQQDHAEIEDQSNIITGQVIVAPIEEDSSGPDIGVIISETNQPIISSEGALIGEQDAHHSTIDSNATLRAPNAHTTLPGPQSNCLPSGFIISMYATGSVLLIAGILACALINPTIAAFVGLTLTATVVNALTIAGSVGIGAGATTILSTWCGYFKPTDTRRVEQLMMGPQLSA